MGIKIQYTSEIAAAFIAGQGRLKVVRIKANGDLSDLYVDMACAEKLEVPQLENVDL